MTYLDDMISFGYKIRAMDSYYKISTGFCQEPRCRLGKLAQTDIEDYIKIAIKHGYRVFRDDRFYFISVCRREDGHVGVAAKTSNKVFVTTKNNVLFSDEETQISEMFRGCLRYMYGTEAEQEVRKAIRDGVYENSYHPKGRWVVKWGREEWEEY